MSVEDACCLWCVVCMLRLKTSPWVCSTLLRACLQHTHGDADKHGTTPHPTSPHNNHDHDHHHPPNQHTQTNHLVFQICRNVKEVVPVIVVRCIGRNELVVIGQKSCCSCTHQQSLDNGAHAGNYRCQECARST